MGQGKILKLGFILLLFAVVFSQDQSVGTTRPSLELNPAESTQIDYVQGIADLEKQMEELFTYNTQEPTTDIITYQTTLGASRKLDRSHMYSSNQLWDPETASYVQLRDTKPVPPPKVFSDAMSKSSAPPGNGAAVIPTGLPTKIVHVETLKNDRDPNVGVAPIPKNIGNYKWKNPSYVVPVLPADMDTLYYSNRAVGAVLQGIMPTIFLIGFAILILIINPLVFIIVLRTFSPELSRARSNQYQKKPGDIAELSGKSTSRKLWENALTTKGCYMATSTYWVYHNHMDGAKTTFDYYKDYLSNQNETSGAKLTFPVPDQKTVKKVLATKNESVKLGQTSNESQDFDNKEVMETQIALLQTMRYSLINDSLLYKEADVPNDKKLDMSGWSQSEATPEGSKNKTKGVCSLFYSVLQHLVQIVFCYCFWPLIGQICVKLWRNLCCCFRSRGGSRDEQNQDEDNTPGESDPSKQAQQLIEQLKKHKLKLFDKKSGMEYIDPSPMTQKWRKQVTVSNMNASEGPKRIEKKTTVAKKSMFGFKTKYDKHLPGTKSDIGLGGTMGARKSQAGANEGVLIAQQYNHEIYGGYNIMRMECCEKLRALGNRQTNLITQEDKATFVLNRGVWESGTEKQEFAWRYFEVDVQNLEEGADITIGFLDGENYQSFVKETKGDNKFQVGRANGSISFSLREGIVMREGNQVTKYNNEINLRNLWDIKDSSPYMFGNDCIGIGIDLISGSCIFTLNGEVQNRVEYAALTELNYKLIRGDYDQNIEEDEEGGDEDDDEEYDGGNECCGRQKVCCMPRRWFGPGCLWGTPEERIFAAPGEEKFVQEKATRMAKNPKKYANEKLGSRNWKQAKKALKDYENVNIKIARKKNLYPAISIENWSDAILHVNLGTAPFKYSDPAFMDGIFNIAADKSNMNTWGVPEFNSDGVVQAKLHNYMGLGGLFSLLTWIPDVEHWVGNLVKEVKERWEKEDRDEEFSN